MSIGTDWWFVGVVLVLLEQWGGYVCVWFGGMNGLCVGVRFDGLEGAAAAAVWVSAPPGLGKRRCCAASLRDPVEYLYCKALLRVCFYTFFFFQLEYLNNGEIFKRDDPSL